MPKNNFYTITLIHTTLLTIAIFQGIVLGLLLTKTSLFNSKSNKYLAYLLFILSLLLLTHVFDIEGVFTSYPILRFIDNIQWVFLLPTFLFLFVRNRTKDSVKNQQKTYLYFIPFIYSAVLNIINDLDFVAGVYKIPTFGLHIITVLGLLQLILAVTFIPFLLIYSYTLLKQIEDTQEKKWMVSIVSLLASLLFSWLFTALIGLFLNYDISTTMSFVALGGTFIIHWIAYMGIYKYRLAKNKEAIYHFLHQDSTVSPPGLQITQANTTVEHKDSITSDNLYFQKLEFLCQEQHIYADSTLNREKVAEELGISPGYVSQIINTITGDNFAQYINQYRVESVKAMISNSEYNHYNLLTMGLESGFTSKTTFYKAFKKITGQTPNEYKNTLK